MQIKRFGQAAFLMTSEVGTRILIDPYDRMIRYRMPKPIEADIVAVTHNHGDHNKFKWHPATMYSLMSQRNIAVAEYPLGDLRRFTTR